MQTHQAGLVVAVDEQLEELGIIDGDRLSQRLTSGFRHGF
jgi:hypothetical protein